jgi:hypothetical protein
MDDLQLKEIIEGLENSSGEEFFNRIVLNLASVIQIEYVFIARLDMRNRLSKTVAVAAKGQIVDNFEYKLQDTPCANVADNSVCCYPNRISYQFPKDELLVQMKIESYLGSPLYDSKGNVLGLMVALGESELKNKELVTTLFHIFSGRISVEMERIEQEKMIQHILYFDTKTELHNSTFLEKNLQSSNI